MSRASVFRWHKRFKQESKEVEHDPRSGRHSTSRNDENIELVKQKMCGDYRLIVQTIANKLAISCERVWIVITKDMGMKKICAKMVPQRPNIATYSSVL